MTSRARIMLDGLEAHDGCATRQQLWQHADRFYLTNNASAELRAAGVDVVYERDTDTYRLLDERHGHTTPVALVEQDDHQFALEVAA